jgi:hypothetical protein
MNANTFARQPEQVSRPEEVFMLFKVDNNKLYFSRRKYHPESLYPHHTLVVVPLFIAHMFKFGLRFQISFL